MAEQDKRSRREILCRDDLWEAYARMAAETGFARDALIQEAMKQFARSRGYGLAPHMRPNPDSDLHAIEPTSARDGQRRASAQPPAPPPVLPAPPVATAPRRLYLFFNGQRYPVDPSEDFVIGRSRTGCHLTIKDSNISRRHAAVAFRNGSYYLQDLGSVNGIEYRGELVDHKRVEEGDVFKLCEYELRFTFSE